jgi:hypothetical protein
MTLSFTARFRSRAHRAQERADATAELKAKLSLFGDDATNGDLKDRIAELRERRDAGSLGPAEYAIRVADLLGTPELGLSEELGTS